MKGLRPIPPPILGVIQIGLVARAKAQVAIAKRGDRTSKREVYLIEPPASRGMAYTASTGSEIGSHRFWLGCPKFRLNNQRPESHVQWKLVQPTPLYHASQPTR